jgi:hypothetical protein
MREREVLRAQHQAAELRATSVRDQEHRHCKKRKIQRKQRDVEIKQTKRTPNYQET